MPSLLDKVKGKLGLKKQSKGHTLGGDSSASQQSQSHSQSQAKPKPKLRKELSDQEKEARRDAMAAAAASREKAWDKKVSKGAQARRQEEKRKEQQQQEEESGSGAFEIQSEETLKTVEAAKRSEQQLAETMGYNPYQPVMSSTMKGSAGSAQVATGTSSGVGVVNSMDSFGDVGDDIQLQLAEAVQCLLIHDRSQAEDCQNIWQKPIRRPRDEEGAASFEKGKVCVDTAVKMLSNLASSPDEPKFRSVRLSNKHFSTKIAEVEGGLELFLCAGFVLEEEATDACEGETFLRHRGEGSQDPLSRRLEFTLSRLRHTQTLYS